MRLVVQRVSSGSVTVGDQVVGQIGSGLVVLVGVGLDDRDEDAAYLAEKVVNLRIFEDEAGKMNRSVLEQGGEILAVSQFTLYGDCRAGRRPSFSSAAPAAEAQRLYELFMAAVESRGVKVAKGVFQEHMLVKLENDGPVTLLLDSHKKF